MSRTHAVGMSAPVVPALTQSAWARPQAERLAEAMDPRLMAPRFAAVLGGGPRTCHVLDAKYEPGIRAVVLYEYAGRLLRGDVLAAEGGPLTKSPGLSSTVAPGVRICAFPNDPDLPNLPGLMDRDSLGRNLADALESRSRALDGRRSARCRILLLRYRPGKRATVHVTWGAGETGLVAKAYHDPVKAAAVADEAPALASLTSFAGTLRFARTVAHLPGLSVVVQEAVKGMPLDALLPNTRTSVPRARDAVSLAAIAMAELHSFPAVSGRVRSVGRELQRFGVRADRIGTVDPRLGAEAAQLASRLIITERDLPAARTGLVHGDCKPSQFLCHGRQVYLLDLDHCGVSDQAGDVGTFLATLRQLATRHALAGRSPAISGELSALADLFLAVYLERAGNDRSRRRVRWQEAVALERKALRAFARAPRSPVAGALVAEANRCLDESLEEE